MAATELGGIFKSTLVVLVAASPPWGSCPPLGARTFEYFLPQPAGLDKMGSHGLWTAVSDMQQESYQSQRPPTTALSTLHHCTHAHFGLTAWFAHRSPGGCGELPEQTDAGACWGEPLCDQPPAPAATEILQLGPLPSKVRGLLPACYPGAYSGLGVSDHGQDQNTYCYQCFEKQLTSVQAFSQIHLNLIETRTLEF